MKRTTARFFLMTVAPVLLCAILTVCGGSPAHVSTADELDAAIREASTYLNGKVPKGSKAVFLNIKSDYPDLSEYILSVLSENAVNDSVFSVVERQQPGPRPRAGRIRRRHSGGIDLPQWQSAERQ